MKRFFEAFESDLGRALFLFYATTGLRNDAYCGRTPKTVLARNYTDYSPERLQKIYEKAALKVLG